MSTGLTAIALFSPVVASNAIFSARRATNGINSMEKNPLFGVANMDIAAAQVVKGGRAAKAIAMTTDESFVDAFKGAGEKIRKISKQSKLLKNVGDGVGKVVKVTANYINPVIIGAGALKVAGSDDKLDATAREATALTTMFGAEYAMKEFVGMPVTVNGKVEHQDGLYKKLFSEKQIKAIKDFCATKKYLKCAPGLAKGLLFVGASIGGYKTGEGIANAILGKKRATA